MTVGRAAACLARIAGGEAASASGQMAASVLLVDKVAAA